MKISSVKLAYFSPTKTTQKILEALTQGVGAEDVEHINLTPPDSRSWSSQIITRITTPSVYCPPGFREKAGGNYPPSPLVQCQTNYDK